ncbi:hypothetical protein U1Q18_011240 [Sarracenia purpurea var. burkii]
MLERRVRSDQRRRVKCSQSAVKPLDLLWVRRSGEASDGEDCKVIRCNPNKVFSTGEVGTEPLLVPTEKSSFVSLFSCGGVVFGKQRFQCLEEFFTGVAEVTGGSSGDRSPLKLIGVFELAGVTMEIAEVSRKVEFGNQLD